MAGFFVFHVNLTASAHLPGSRVARESAAIGRLERSGLRPRLLRACYPPVEWQPSAVRNFRREEFSNSLATSSLQREIDTSSIATSFKSPLSKVLRPERSSVPPELYSAALPIG